MEHNNLIYRDNTSFSLQHMVDDKLKPVLLTDLFCYI